jgi:predicted transcriptional regulator
MKNCACLPQKAESTYLIPAIRKELAVILRRKLSDAEIARRLGLTKSAISQYAHKKRASSIKFPVKIKKEINKSAKAVIKGKNAKAEIVKILDLARETNYTCSICREVCK